MKLPPQADGVSIKCFLCLSHRKRWGIKPELHDKQGFYLDVPQTTTLRKGAKNYMVLRNKLFFLRFLCETKFNRINYYLSYYCKFNVLYYD